MPTIAIAPCRQMADYVESIRRAGAEVVELTHDEAPGRRGRAGGRAAADRRRRRRPGALRRRTPTRASSAAEPGRDAFEIALVRAALAADLPVLAICRGMQVLNVACGGDLVQDIPTEVNGALPPRRQRAALRHGPRGVGRRRRRASRR